MIIILLLIACDRAKDAKPVNPLWREWQLASEETSNCGNDNGVFYGTLNQKLVLTSIKLADGNYSCTYQGVNMEYRLNGDSIVFAGWKRGTYTITNVLTITGTIDYNKCNFKDRFQ